MPRRARNDIRPGSRLLVPDDLLMGRQPLLSIVGRRTFSSFPVACVGYHSPVQPQ